MTTRLVIDKKEFHDKIGEDVGTIIKDLHPDATTFFEKEDGDLIYYTINKKLPIDDLMKNIKDCHVRCRNKRLDKLLMIDCKVIKYNGEYYILDGDKKIALFE